MRGMDWSLEGGIVGAERRKECERGQRDEKYKYKYKRDLTDTIAVEVFTNKLEVFKLMFA